LEGDHPDLVNRLVHWLYTHKYDHDFQSPFTPSRLMKHVKMYALAAKYDLPDLKIEVKWAFGQDLDWFRARCREIPDVIRLVYETAPEMDFGLRNVLTTFIWNNKALALLEPGIQTCVRECKGLGDDILAELFREMYRRRVRQTDEEQGLSDLSDRDEMFGNM
jgi:hypothetical protein